jgi:hypothetical protein
MLCHAKGYPEYDAIPFEPNLPIEEKAGTVKVKRKRWLRMQEELRGQESLF